MGAKYSPVAPNSILTLVVSARWSVATSYSKCGMKALGVYILGEGRMSRMKGFLCLYNKESGRSKRLLIIWDHIFKMSVIRNLEMLITIQCSSVGWENHTNGWLLFFIRIVWHLFGKAVNFKTLWKWISSFKPAKDNFDAFNKL